MSRRPPSSHKPGPSQRQLRVAEEIRHILAGILLRGELRDPALVGVSITVSEVRISPDLKNATVYSLPFGKASVAEVMKGLNRSAPYLRSQVGHALSLRYTPTLTFVPDHSFDEAKHIDDLLRSEKVARDLKHGDEKK
jgi:ribosome-binding factor A